jgi:two-component system sensor histidine kinase CpxA
MRSLFAKILLWFLAAMIITVLGFVVTTEMSLRATRGRGHLLSQLLAFPMEEARHAYETGGREALGRFLGRFRAVFDAEGVLTDAEGHDLLTGQDRHDLIVSAQRRIPLAYFRRGPIVITHASDSAPYWFFLVLPSPRGRFPFFLPQNLWIVGVVVVLSYALALHLSSPLRLLQRAVERFGQGDFSARVKSQRRDELGDLARTFDRMAERIQTLLTAERRLLLDISHELRSPLARLAVAVELARSGEDREAALSRIEKEAERLNALVGELLQVTRAEGDPSSLHMEPVRLDELVGELVEDCSVEAQARGCRLTLDAPLPLTVQGDGELLRRAVENVIRNAIRHTPADTPVEVRLESNGKVCITVRDYGPGVPDEFLPRIFDPFYRVDTDRNRSSGGVGLGLAIARRAIELHKGAIRARNASPGLLVEIELPNRRTPA